MTFTFPLDLKAEALLGYLPRDKRNVELKGSHKRNAYEDIAEVCCGDGEILNIAIARNGMYDVLPESLFHPIDRFDNIPANEYKERFKEECELQQLEEEKARRYFKIFDNSLMELSVAVNEAKDSPLYSEILQDIICDRLSDRYKANRFIMKAKGYLPLCRHIRGNKTLMLFMLRHILLDENIKISERVQPTLISDSQPSYNYRLDDDTIPGGDTFLGSDFNADVTVYDIVYWREEECDQNFLSFVSDMETFSEFLNDWFIGIGAALEFNITTTSLPVRLSDDLFYTYLDYNTNI